MLLAISRAYFLPSLAVARSSAATSQKSSTLSVAGIAFDLAGEAEEGEVVGRRIGAAAIQRQAAGLGGLLVVFGDFRVGLRAEIGQQLVFVAEFDRDGRVFGDLARRS